MSIAKKMRSCRAHLLCSTGLVFAGAILASTAASAQDEAMETVVITGSRIAVTSSFDAPTPVSVVSAQDIKLSGTVNVETLLNQSPQFTPSTWGGQTGNTVQANGDSGAAWVNLRGLGEVRNLVLVNGRRFAIQGTRMTTDLNTIPTSLIERTEVVTGGNSAVYGSDAISGVVNFVMKQNFQGVEGNAQYKFDQFTVSPIYNFDLTVGGNFDHDKGNVVMAVNYMDRHGFTAGDHGGWTDLSFREGCVTKDSYTPNGLGTPLAGIGTGASCVAAGGVNGFVQGGSGDVPNGYINQIASYANANSALKGLYDAAGLTNMTADGIIFDGEGGNPNTIRDRNSAADLYSLSSANYMQLPQERWMVNSFAHYTFDPKIEGYAEFHFSSNTVSAQLAPSNANGFMLFDTHDPSFPAALQPVFDYLDQNEAAGSNCFVVGPASNNVCTTRGDGLVKLGYGKRFVENGLRRQDANRVTWRFAGGFRGVLGDVDPNFLKDVSYDVYYTFARTQETDRQQGSISRSKLQSSVLASSNGGTPLCDLFGVGSMSQACIDAITVNSTVLTISEMQDVNASISGTAFDLPAGPVQFVAGTEWRYTMAEYSPDLYTSSGDVAGLNGAKPTKGAIVAHEAFGELRVPVLSDLPFVRKFTINSAFRYSDYNLSAAKNIWTWSMGADWKVIPDLTLRGQFQRAIRAPNVGELYGGLASNSTGTLVDPCGFRQPTEQRTDAVKTLCLAQGVSATNIWTNAVQGPADLIQYISGGNPDLSPETSDTITLGVVVQPEAVPGLATSIDFYSIQVKDMISALAGGAGGILTNCFGQSDPGNIYCQQIRRVGGMLTAGTGYIMASNANISSMKTQGFDFSAQYSYAVDWGLLSKEGRFDVTTNWNWLLEMVSLPDVTKPDVQSSCAGTFGNTYCGYKPQPRVKGTSRITWNDGPVSLSLNWRYLGSNTVDLYLVPLRRGDTSVKLANFTRPVMPEMHYFDVSATWDVNDNIQLYGGINNLFSKDPPIVSGGTYANSFPETYDPFGRVTFIGIKAKTN
jgi:iron complex outermembrane recepter protein